MLSKEGDQGLEGLQEAEIMPNKFNLLCVLKALIDYRSRLHW